MILKRPQFLELKERTSKIAIFFTAFIKTNKKLNFSTNKKFYSNSFLVASTCMKLLYVCMLESPGALKIPGVPVVAQWLTNPTRNHEVAGSIPALAQWVKDPALP